MGAPPDEALCFVANTERRDALNAAGRTTRKCETESMRHSTARKVCSSTGRMQVRKLAGRCRSTRTYLVAWQLFGAVGATAVKKRWATQLDLTWSRLRHPRQVTERRSRRNATALGQWRTFNSGAGESTGHPRVGWDEPENRWLQIEGSGVQRLHGRAADTPWCECRECSGAESSQESTTFRSRTLMALTARLRSTRLRDGSRSEVATSPQGLGDIRQCRGSQRRNGHGPADGAKRVPSGTSGVKSAGTRHVRIGACISVQAPEGQQRDADTRVAERNLDSSRLLAKTRIRC